MSNTESSSTAEIRAAIEDWAEALRQKDAGRVLSHGTQDCLVFSLAPPLKGSDADAEGLEQWFSTWRGPIGYRLQDLDISASGDVAFATSLAHLSGEKQDGEKVALWYRQTLGLKRTEKGWKIAHQHESVPFYMDGSLRAAVDLEPTSKIDWNGPPSHPPMAGVIAYLNVENADATAKFYGRAFAAKEEDRKYAEDGKRLIHCHLTINGGALMLNDPFPEFGFPWRPPEGFVLHLIVDDAHFWWERAIAAGAEATMPLEIAFWGDYYGQLRDPFGITWGIVAPVKKSD
ncbi:glyoxalase family protein [Sinorhizobium americanum CCGM7]|uniref:nuclear transport factor 2 family protein n=1 Tax=Sinorhizobium americanum TaxID=194963 RepID=UPI0004D7A8F1|nr:nuclear transport factor 2 family protein [Sinorhizobium americanum]APG83170.1 glyoxalase family protein [Sinorhizobium americanum CCGM7]